MNSNTNSTPVDVWSPWGIIKKSIARLGDFDKLKMKVMNDNKLNLLPFS